MNDADIIKALECCALNYYCIECPLTATRLCIPQMSENVINLINRQEAEIVDEREKKEMCAEVIKRLEKEKSVITADWNELLKDNNRLKELLKTVKSEAIKAFAERLKESAFECDVSFGFGKEHYTRVVSVIEIDNLVKEMTEGEQHESV